MRKLGMGRRTSWSRVIRSALIILMFAALTMVLSSCASEDTSSQVSDEQQASVARITPTDDIVTLTPVDTSKTVITIRTEYNIDDSHMEQALEEQFPDIDFVFTLHCSGVTSYELRQSLESGTAEDIILSPNMTAISDIAPDTLVDLSAESFTDNYEGTILDGCDVDGKLYYLPGPSSIYGIVYDKTLFEQHGWSVPTSYSEFISLCDTIEASGIRAIQPTCRYARQAQMVFSAFSYDDAFGGVDNYAWLMSYQEGGSTMEGHLEPAFQRYSELQSAGVIEASDFDVQPGNRSRMMYVDHTCAMIIENQLAQTYARQAGSDHEYAMMPFWCGDGENSDHLVTLPNYYIGVNANLTQEGEGDRYAKVMEVLDWMSTPEGQLALGGGSLDMVSSIKGTPTSINDFNQGVQSTIEKGNCVSEVNLMSSGNGNLAEVTLQKGLRSYLEGSMTAEQVMASCDAARDDALMKGFDRGTVVGRASRDFTRLQTGLFVADALRARADADIGLCIVGQVNCGELGRIYAGDITDKDVQQLSLSIGKTGNGGNDKKLWKLSMTGAQLEDLLATPYTTPDTDSIWNQPYFVASGLEITFAPWAPTSGKLESVTLADGSPIDPDATYTVAMWCWPFSDACPYTVLQVFDDSDTDILSAAVTGQSTISPDSEGRFTLDWDTTV